MGVAATLREFSEWTLRVEDLDPLNKMPIAKIQEKLRFFNSLFAQYFQY